MAAAIVLHLASVSQVSSLSFRGALRYGGHIGLRSYRQRPRRLRKFLRELSLADEIISKTTQTWKEPNI